MTSAKVLRCLIEAARPETDPGVIKSESMARNQDQAAYRSQPAVQFALGCKGRRPKGKLHEARPRKPSFSCES